jgi:hypothetical protein
MRVLAVDEMTITPVLFDGRGVAGSDGGDEKLKDEAKTE